MLGNFPFKWQWQKQEDAQPQEPHFHSTWHLSPNTNCFFFILIFIQTYKVHKAEGNEHLILSFVLHGRR